MWRALVEEYWPAGQVDDALSVMECESKGDPNAYNEASGASGLFQFLPGTWTSASVSAGWAGADVFYGEANIAVAAWLSGSAHPHGRTGTASPSRYVLTRPGGRRSYTRLP